MPQNGCSKFYASRVRTYFQENNRINTHHLCNGEYIKLVKNTVSSSNPGNYVFSNQTKTSSKYGQNVFAFALSMLVELHTILENLHMTFWTLFDLKTSKIKPDWELKLLGHNDYTVYLQLHSPSQRWAPQQPVNELALDFLCEPSSSELCDSQTWS